MERSINLLKKLYHFSNSWTGTIIIVLLIIFFVAQAFVIPSGSMKSTMLIGDHLFVKKFAYGVSTPRIPWIEVPIMTDFDDNGHVIEGERPKRGDIVIFRFPEDERIHYVKRCVAVGGDEVLFAKQKLLIHPKEGDDAIEEIFGDVETMEIAGKRWAINPYAKKHVGVQYEDGHGSFEQMIQYLQYSQNLPMQPVKTEQFDAFYAKIDDDNFFMVGDNRDHSNDSRFWGQVPYKYIVGKPWFIYFSWDDDYKIRWSRIGKSIDTIEEEMQSGNFTREF